MKSKIKFSQTLKALLVAGLLAAPMLAFHAMAQTTEDNHWSPLDLNSDGTANFEDPNNWTLVEVPTYTDPNNGDVERVIINGTLGTPGTYVACVITNNAAMYQLIMGDDGTAGGGDLIITNGAQVTADFSPAGVDNGQYTGVGFPNGPSTLYIGPGCSFTIGSHLWVGQGTNNGNPALGTVIVDGGTLNIPNGQLGVGWNGTGGTNYITFENGGKLFLDTWASPTLGPPGNTNSLGIMNLASNNCYVQVTNNQTGYFPVLTNNNQLIAYGGQGTITWTYNPSANITTISAVAPPNPNTPVISVPPTNEIVSLGSTTAFHVGISNVPVNYQWMFNGSPLTDGGAISGSQTATLTITGVQKANVGNYVVVATNSNTHVDFIQSQAVSLSTSGINLYPVITVLGVPGDTYVTSYSTTVNGTYIPFATNTVASFAPLYVVDTSTPLSVTRFYKTVQQ